MPYRAAMKASISIYQLFLTAVLLAEIVTPSAVLESMAQDSCPWLHLTQPWEGDEGSDSDISFISSAVSSELFTTQQSMASSLDLDFETAFSTPTIIPVPAYDSQTLSFAEAVHLTQTLDDGREGTNWSGAETEPQYCSLEMLSNKALPLRQRPIHETKDSTFFDASETYEYSGRGTTDSLSNRKVAGLSSALLLTYGKVEETGP